jgi:hypothetical protein
MAIRPTRRTVLNAGAVGAVVAGHAVAGATPAGAGVPVVPDLAAFRRALGSTFGVALPDQSSLLLRLDEAVALPVRSRMRGSGDAFSLIFRGASLERVPSATYAVQHAVLGRFELFLNPVGPKRAYQAVINRWLPLGVHLPRRSAR